MTIDGFEPSDTNAFTAFKPARAEAFYAVVRWCAQRLKVDVEGVEKVPAGRALIVANHAFGWDAMLPMGAVWEQLHRPVWALGEHLWWKLPFVRTLATAVGTVDGNAENVNALLSREQLVLVLPGGLREAVKPRELRYQLLWGHRFGFIRAAIENQAPIVPLACIGSDDLFDFVGNAEQRGLRWLRRSGVPIPLPARLLPIPRFVKLRYIFGEPIPPPPREQLRDETALRRYRHEVEGALHELIEIELARRAGIDLR